MRQEKILILFLILCASFLYAYVINSNQTISDARVYYYFYEKGTGYSFFEYAEFIYKQTGKFEPLLYFSYKIILPGGLSLFWFSYYNMVVLFLLYFIMARKILFASVGSKYNLMLFFLMSFWYLNYASFLWVWRSQIAFVMVGLGILFYKEKKLWLSFAFVMSAPFFHYAALAILVLGMGVIAINKTLHKFSLGSKLFFYLLAGVAVGVAYESVRQYLATNVITWQTNSYTAHIALAYFITIFISSCYVAEKIRGRRSAGEEYIAFENVACFITLSIGIALVAGRDHLDITRIMQAGYLLYPFLFIFVYNKAKKIERIALLSIMLIGVAPSLYSMVKFIAN